jgi:golgi phosphoprotein 3
MEKTVKKTELSLPEKIILLALNDKGWFGSSESIIKFGLAGAILFELVQLKRIEIKDGLIYVIDPKPTDVAVLDKVLDLLKSSKKMRGVRAWIQRIAYRKLMLRKQVLKQLMQKKAITKEEFSIMMVFYQTKFPILNGEMKQQIIEYLSERIMADQILLDQDLMLLVVMKNCKLIRKNFGGILQYLKLRRKINVLTQLSDPKTETEKTIGIIQTAMSRAIIASNVSLHL